MLAARETRTEFEEEEDEEKEEEEEEEVKANLNGSVIVEVEIKVIGQEGSERRDVVVGVGVVFGGGFGNGVAVVTAASCVSWVTWEGTGNLAAGGYLLFRFRWIKLSFSLLSTVRGEFEFEFETVTIDAGVEGFFAEKKATP